MVHAKEKAMKHIRTIARGFVTTPKMAQSSLEVKVDFLVNLTDRIITIIMHAASGL